MIAKKKFDLQAFLLRELGGGTIQWHKDVLCREQNKEGK